MKLYIAYSILGCQKKVEIDDDGKLGLLYASYKRLVLEVSGEQLGDEFKKNVFKIMDSCDKKYFPMKEEILTQGCVRLLMHQADSMATLLKVFEGPCRVAEGSDPKSKGDDPPNFGNGGNGSPGGG